MSPARREGLLRIAALIAVGVAIGAGLHTFHYARGTSYLSDDPEACANCHVMRDHLAAWVKGPHHGHATCNDCHVPQMIVSKYMAKAQHGVRHSVAFTLQNFHEPIRSKPSSLAELQQNCLRCHGDMVGGIRQGHTYAGEDVSCLRCHANIGHDPTR